MRDIPGYEGLYAATSCGKVYSYRAKKFLKPNKHHNGYLQVGLYKDGKRKQYYLHRLIASTYLDNPDNLPQVNHIDEDKTNNALSNLEWISPKDNINYGTRTERVAKSLSKKVICIETDEVFNSIKEAAKVKNTDAGHIVHCCKGQRKTAGGYHWRYYEENEEN